MTPAGMKRLQDAICLSEILENGGNRYTLDQLSDRINLSTKTLSRLWSLHTGVDQKTLRLCFSTFNLKLRLEDYVVVSDEDANDLEADSNADLAPTSPSSQKNYSSSIYPAQKPIKAPIEAPIDRGNVPHQLLSLPYPSGPLPLDSPFYINRAPLEKLAYQEIAQPGCVIRIRAPRGMGKSSLALRLLDHAESLGYGTVLLDCNQIENDYLHDLDRLLRCFCQRVAIELGIPPRLNDYWDDEIGSKLSCTLYFKHYLLQQFQTPFVLALNAIDCLFKYSPIVQDFFPMLRSWHEAARRDRDWQKLRQVIIYCPEEYPALDINCSPLNIGLPLRLQEFTPQQVQELAHRYGLDWNMDQVDLLMARVGGHPTMIQIAFYYLCCEGVPLETLLQQAMRDGGVFDYYLQQRWDWLKKQPHLLKAFVAVVRSEQGIQLEPSLVRQLESYGLIRFEDDRIVPRCHLYRVYFKQHMLSYQSSESSL